MKEIVYRRDKRRAKMVARRAGSVAVRFDEAQLDGDIVWLCVGDGAISATAEAIRDRVEWKGKQIFHSSGALSSDELRGLKRKGASVASVHPMMSFVRSAEASLKDVSFALEGDPKAVRTAAAIVKALGGTSFNLSKRDKPLYHALGAFSSPLLVAQLAAAERIGRKLGLAPKETRRVIGPILQQTLANYLKHGPAAAFSGPLVRGDVETIERNLAALKRVPGSAAIYRALAKAALTELPVKNRAAIRLLLK